MELMDVSNSRPSGENSLGLGRKSVFWSLSMYVHQLRFFLCRSFLESATRILRGSLKIPSSFVYAAFWGLFFFLHFLAYDGVVLFFFFCFNLPIAERNLSLVFLPTAKKIQNSPKDQVKTSQRNHRKMIIFAECLWARQRQSTCILKYTSFKKPRMF